MTLPEIPDEAYRAAAAPAGPGDVDVHAGVVAAWPHLYAAALRHAAETAEDETSWWKEGLSPDWLRRMADEATP